MNKLYFLMLMCVGTTPAIGQSQAGAYASATVVSPVGAELISDMQEGYASIDFISRTSTTSSGKEHATNNLSSEHTITSVASIKIIGSVNVFDVSIQKDAIILRNAFNETMEATVASEKVYSSQRFENSDATIDISAKITGSAVQAKGLYKSAAPYTVIINYN